MTERGPIGREQRRNYFKAEQNNYVALSSIVDALPRFEIGFEC
jgi:hypothetical protein